MPFMQTIFRGTSGSNPGNNQKEAERDDMIACHCGSGGYGGLHKEWLAISF